MFLLVILRLFGTLFDTVDTKSRGKCSEKVGAAIDQIIKIDKDSNAMKIAVYSRCNLSHYNRN